MRSNKKHTTSELEGYIQLFINDRISYQELNGSYGLLLSESIFRRKVSRYKEHGVKGIQSKGGNNHYSSKFKKQIVLEHLQDNVPIQTLARTYTIPSHNTVRNWVIKYTKEEGLRNYSPKPEVYTMKSRKTTEQEKLEIVKDCLENELSYKKTAKKYHVSYNSVYSWVQKYKVHGPDGLLDRRECGKPTTIQTNEEKIRTELAEWIIQVYEEHKGIYGYRRMTIYLNHYRNAKVNHKCVYRLMKSLGLKAIIRRRRYNYKPHKPMHIAENLLNRKFQKTYGSMEVLLTDVTEFKYGRSSKTYLSAILDYGINKIVAFKLSKTNNNALVNSTVDQIENSTIPEKTMIHSDRGFQYTSHDFKKFIEENKLLQSMSRVGKCIDNGSMENFWGIIKEEMYRLKHYAYFKDLEADIKKYVHFYNTKRVTLKMKLSIPAQKGHA